MASHEEIWSFRQVRCLYSSCGWVHCLNKLAGHLAQQHSVNVIAVQEDRAELVLQDPTNKQNSMRMVFLLHHDSVFVVTYERTGPFYTEAKLDVVTLTPRCGEYEFEIIIRGPSLFVDPLTSIHGGHGHLYVEHPKTHQWGSVTHSSTRWLAMAS
ncbi:uncharacterized protein LOC142575826 [Dermacentor variabilis]|uniref:uncharacterized protein LOC142575826 n=1 Tax=Dermacentor variabilis TaxID=34621 RepID=UPI003F5B73EB